MVNAICKGCHNNEDCDTSCPALIRLYKAIREHDQAAKAEMISNYKKELQLSFAEPDPETEAIANKIIDKYPEFSFIREMGIKIGFVQSYETKTKDGKDVLGTCQKVNEVYKAYLPFDYIITIYKNNTHYLNDNQYKILILHELRHITIGMRGLAIRPHDIEDFKDIIKQFGIDWSNDSTDLPDILAGSSDCNG